MITYQEEWPIVRRLGIRHGNQWWKTPTWDCSHIKSSWHVHSEIYLKRCWNEAAYVYANLSCKEHTWPFCKLVILPAIHLSNGVPRELNNVGLDNNTMDGYPKFSIDAVDILVKSTWSQFTLLTQRIISVLCQNSLHNYIWHTVHPLIW